MVKLVLFLSLLVGGAQSHEQALKFKQVYNIPPLEEFKEITPPDTSQNQLLLEEQNVTLTELDPDKLMLREVQEQMIQIEKDLEVIAELMKLTNEQIHSQGENLNTVEEKVENTVVAVEETVVELQEAAKYQPSNTFLSYFIKDGVPLGTGVGVGTAGYVAATKAAILVPALAAVPTAVPVVLATAVGGVSFIALRYGLSKFI